MSLLAKLQATTGPAPGVKAKMKELAGEEVAIKYPWLAGALAKLETLGLGMPQLSGEAAKDYAALKNIELMGAGFAGSGELAAVALSTTTDIQQLVTEAEALVASRKLPPAAALAFPEDAPASKASPDEPEVKKVETVEDALAAAVEPKKRGPKSKKKAEPEPETTAPAETVVVVEGGKINLFVDCIPSEPHTNLWPIINEITKQLADKYGGTDYRTTDEKGPLGFGRYKGYIAAGLRDHPFEPGNYVLDSSMSDTGSIALEAMRDIAHRSGGLIVRGSR